MEHDFRDVPRAFRGVFRVLTLAKGGDASPGSTGLRVGLICIRWENPVQRHSKRVLSELSALRALPSTLCGSPFVAMPRATVAPQMWRGRNHLD